MNSGPVSISTLMIIENRPMPVKAAQQARKALRTRNLLGMDWFILLFLPLKGRSIHANVDVDALYSAQYEHFQNETLGNAGCRG
jgi:hypothetical protein